MNIKITSVKPTASSSPATASNWRIHRLDSILIGLSIWFATFGRPGQNSGITLSEFGGPIGYLIEYGRYLSLGSLAALLIVSALKKSSHIRPVIPLKGPLIFLAALQGFFLMKTLAAGNITVAGLGLASLALQFTALYAYVFQTDMKAHARSTNFMSLATNSIAHFGVLFAAVNLIAYLQYPGSSLNDFGRFFGTMSNPQHFGMCAVLALPALCFGMRRAARGVIWPAMLLSAVIILLFLIYQTGSRSSLFAALLAITIASRDLLRGPLTLIALLLGVALVVAVGFEILLPVYNDFWIRFVENRGDTRSAIWRVALERFFDYPLFGAPTDASGRVVISETVWLSALGSGGLFGAICVLLMLSQLFHRLSFFTRNSARSSVRNLHLAALSSILALSLFEALFLGLLTGMTMLTILYFTGAEAEIAYRRRVAVSARNQPRRQPR
jgi:O-antigen ligase